MGGLLYLFMRQEENNGGIISGLQRYDCRKRNGWCALIGCIPKEEQIGRCSLSGRTCCRKKK
ncbi:hypothetical protein FD755_024128 [Muntiacus reevesi]|uniref:Beta-defensin-like domain-containing protein n=1 Tax=Muntiacus reevesi TaxID=9886 RepID=A0A5N3VXJ4_MUNRE|nr:hypothetical protein FD755_024128 [Muntiacus reevesi]